LRLSIFFFLWLSEKITRHISLSLDDPGDYQPLELLGKALSSQLTPAWWTDGNTQFGLLKTIGLDKKGVSLDGVLKTESINIDAFALALNPYISFKIAIKKNWPGGQFQRMLRILSWRLTTLWRNFLII
jgi:hypothetical protein